MLPPESCFSVYKCVSNPFTGSVIFSCLFGSWHRQYLKKKKVLCALGLDPSKKPEKDKHVGMGDRWIDGRNHFSDSASVYKKKKKKEEAKYAFQVLQTGAHFG